MTALTKILPAAPEIFLAVAAMLLMMIGVFASQERAMRIVSSLAMLTILVTMGISVLQGQTTSIAFNGLFVINAFTVFTKVLVLLGSLLTLIISQDYARRERMAQFEFPILILFATVGMMMMISANDLISLYLGIELQSLSLYVIAAFQRDTVRSSEAGLKYFVLGALSSGMLLYGCSLIYGFAGTTQFAQLTETFHGNGQASLGVVVGVVFLTTGLAFKVSAVPFHMWTPDVYEGAPTPVTAFFSVAPKIAAIALFVRTMIGPLNGLVADWQQIIIAISIASMTLGALAAIAQTNIKRLMAYSSIGHVGYALIGLAAGTEAGVHGILVYMSIYLAMNIGTFTCILSMRRNGQAVEEIDDLAGFGKTHPRMAFAMLVFMFSMAGIPPLAGFFGKLYVFLAAIQSGLFTLAIIGVVTSVIGAYYYLRIIKIMYFDEPTETLDRQTARPVGFVMAFAAFVTTFFIIWPTPVIDSAAIAAAALFPG
jgi:NADH-quinone oxidoreductase subunit N